MSEIILPGQEERVEDKSGLTYVADPTVAAFLADRSFYSAIMGPFRSGKSTACVQKALIVAAEQKPSLDTETGRMLRRTRGVVVRQTYPELLSTTLRTWQAWIPKSRMQYTMQAPIRGKMVVPWCVNGKTDGTWIDMEVDFLAMEREDDKRKLLGTEYTWAWVNEAREVPWAIIEMLSRVGSYPYKIHGGATWSGIWMDTNPPNTRSDFYKTFELKKPDGWRIFKQPGGLMRQGSAWVPNPRAENVQNLEQGMMYYLRMIEGKDDEWIKVYAGGEYGSVFDGRPVYELYYRDSTHRSPFPLGWFRGVPMVYGVDFGLTPAFILGQVAPAGNVNILREYLGEYMGIEQLLSEVVRPALARDFPGCILGVGEGDPAGKQKNQGDIRTPDCFEILARNGFQARPARTNDIVIRRQAVIDLLSRQIGGRPALQIDPSCVMLLEGFIGGYQFQKVQAITVEPRYKDIPEKNVYSHPHDALQYLCMGVGHPTLQVGRKRAPERKVSIGGGNGWDAYR